MVQRWLVPVVTLVSLLLSVAAVALALRPVTDRPGRMVHAATRAAYQPLQPTSFALDDFSLMLLDDGRVMALYSYPPGYFGHERGCTIRWDSEATFEGAFAGSGATPVPAAQSGPFIRVTGLWVENCGGAKWDAEGRLLFGPGGRDLDRFPVMVDAEGTIRVDTRRLQCTGTPCRRVPAAR